MQVCTVLRRIQMLLFFIHANRSINPRRKIKKTTKCLVNVYVNHLMIENVHILHDVYFIITNEITALKI